MPQRKWTESQEDAINARGGTLIVSAAAGSGKTAVLVQRVIEKITDKHNPIDADKLMIVTFTNAAAYEMKVRIASRLRELVSLEPNNLHLQRQQILLTHSHISTIHSFCSELIKENFYKLSISSDFKIADSSELDILKNEAMQEVLEKLYNKDDSDFLKFIETFSTAKNDKNIENIIFSLYESMRSNPFPRQWFEDKLRMYDVNEGLSDTKWAKAVFNFSISAIEHAISLTKSSLELIEEDVKIKAAYKEAFKSDLLSLEDLKCSLEKNNWDACYNKLKNFKYASLKQLRGYNEDQLKIRVNNNRDTVKDIIKKLNKYFLGEESSVLEDISKLRPIINKLFEAVLLFWDKLDELKFKKDLLDFSDLEHLALKLLVKKTADGYERTKEAVAISEKFEEVMVDEYQDTNEIQDIIFRAISKDENNMFVVGDVKQSIYRFRQAMPEIFLRRKQNYTLYDRNTPKYPAKVILDKNFRSREGITDAVNFVFSQLMSKEVGDMDYTASEELVFGASYPQREKSDTEFHLIELGDGDMDTVEAKHIAAIIQEKIFKGEKVFENGVERNITYKDFCILLMSANKHAANYAKELELSGIPVYTDAGGEFFDAQEIATMLSLLSIIDNPIQDIPLVSILLSPIFGFTVDKLSEIRLTDKKTSLYLALQKMADSGDKECQNFINEIAKYRQIASVVSTDVLLDYIYDRTSYPSMVQSMDNGQERLANLRLLVDYARNYELSGYNGVFGFMRFIEKLRLRESDLLPASTVSESSNVVRIMTIHRSKGLEFPVCIVAGCSRKFNSERDLVLFHPHMGVGIKLKDDETMVSYTTLPREVLNIEISKDEISENLRVLYVAMTRAKESLIMLSSLKDVNKTVTKLSSQLTDSDKVSEFLVRNVRSLSDWLIYCALRHPSGKELRKLSLAEPGIMLNRGKNWDIKIITPENNNEELCETTAVISSYDNEFIQKIEKRINFEYSLTSLHNIPTKISASELFEERKLNDKTFYKQPTVPNFMRKEGSSSAAKGTTLHTFLQFADYENAAENLDDEIAAVCSKGFLSKTQSDMLDKEKLLSLFKSDLMKRIIKSEKFMREVRFVVDYKAGLLSDEVTKELCDELVVLQGAVDCVFIEDGKAVIVDYKTNAFESIDEYRDKYEKQLELYKYSIERYLNVEVKECIIYSLKINKEIYV